MASSSFLDPLLSRPLTHSPLNNILFLAYMVLFSILFSNVSAGNCSFEAVPFNITRQFSIFELRPLSVTVYPALNGEKFRGEDVSVRLSVYYLIERARESSDPERCPRYLNEDALNVGGTEIYRYFETSKHLDCYMEHGIDTTTFPGVLREYVQVTLTNSTFPDFKMTLTYSVVNKSFDHILSNDTSYTTGILLTGTYGNNSLKVAYDVQNWPWNGPDTGSNTTISFLSMHSKYRVAYTPGFFDPIISYTLIGFNFLASDYLIRLAVDRGFIIDGIPYLTRDDDEAFPALGYLDTDQEIEQWLALAICPSNLSSRFTRLQYDPSLSALFIPSDKSPTGSNKWKIAVAVAVPVTVLLVVAIILVVHFSETLKNKIRPYRVRNKVGLQKLDTLTSGETKEQQTQALWKKPSIPTEYK